MLTLDELLAAARSLALAARWEQATGLLDAVHDRLPPGPQRARVALLAAEIAVDSAWYDGNGDAPARLSTVDEEALGPDGRWDLGFARFRCAYYVSLRRVDPALRERAEHFVASAPDPTRLGWAHMYLGLVYDNILDERAGAPQHYEIALANCAADPLLRREAQRHLGDHDHDAGDHAGALARWRDATAAGAAAGTVGGTLAQQILLAVLARDAGDEAGALALAAEVQRWATAIGAARIAAQAAAFQQGVDPTQPPAS
ncbi:hypothetical protein Dvina_26960 [Dactylosporangium vinaceum]|uniref:Uncharacterized protein n=1 Tax=Dactylosporangium vinaceum TaxID=53362 RepID=A0ABV5MC28_9ACTN|nr:hypothetical protein [Dactylosporangium vinaceum]UAB92043.1 hypothetical protein Dvina_26960 [Dactylosporangium vinaceum]